MTETEVTLLDIGDDGSRLEVSALLLPNPSNGEPWFSVDLRVEAAPFQGVLTAIFTLSDLHQWGRELSVLLSAPASAVLGGDRAAELVIECEAQAGGVVGRQVIEIRLTPSGDDPYPRLTWLIFDVETTVWNAAADRALALR